MTDWARELAETPNTYLPLRPGHDRIVTDRFALWLGGGDHPGWNVTQRFRFRADELGEVRQEIHAQVRAKGRKACSWEVGSSATPSDLVERLLALGLVEDAEPLRVGMALTAAPSGASELEVGGRGVTSSGASRLRSVRPSFARHSSSRRRPTRTPFSLSPTSTGGRSRVRQARSASTE